MGADKGLSQSKSSSYVEYLPTRLQTDPFLGQFLLAFEAILLKRVSKTENQSRSFQAQILEKRDSNSIVGFEEILNHIEAYFDPKQTPKEFLPWLASWVALSLRDEWNEDTKQNFIQYAVQLYRQRGTKEGLARLLELYVNPTFSLQGDAKVTDNVSIDEFDYFPTHYFQVKVKLSSQAGLERQKRIIRSIIDQQKPAHTFYTLKLVFPTMQIRDNPGKGKSVKLVWDEIQGKVGSTYQEEIKEGRSEIINIQGIWLGINSKLGTSDEPNSKDETLKKEINDNDRIQ